MSAGGLSYDCLTTSRKVTLPSVEMWGTNMNILRDPPASKYTRRIDKVGDTQEVLLAQEDSGDRIAEMINVYARGVNPMVSVSYDNYGNNAGARNSILQGGRAVKLPYKPEVFHPPVFRQEDLMPLSRQPRTWFYALSNPEIPNIVHQMSCPESRSSVWTDDKMLHVDAPARIQYNKESPLTNVDLPQNHKSVRQDLLIPDRLCTTQPQPERRSFVDAIDPKTIQQKILMASADSGICIPTSGNHHDLMEKHDPKHLQHNRNLYSVFANKKGNTTASIHDFVQKLQHRAILENPLPVQSVTSNVAQIDQSRDMYQNVNAPYQWSGRTRENALKTEADARLSGMYIQDVQSLDRHNDPKEARHEFLYKEVQTKPSRTMFWKPSEHLGQEPIPATNAIHDQIAHTEHIPNKQIPSIENVLAHTSLSHEPTRSLPLVESRTNRTGLYTQQSPSHETLAKGAVVDHKRNTFVQSSHALPSRASPIDDFQNVPISVRETLHTSATSSRGRDQASLQDVLYHDTSMTLPDRPNLPSTEAYTHKTFLDKNEWVSANKELQPRRLANIETDTYRDASAQGYDVYTVQGRDGSGRVSHAPSAGSFDPRPSGVPQMDRSHDHGFELPVHHRTLQRNASNQYFERFSDPFH